MFGIESTVPVYFTIVEAEYAIFFADLDVHVVGAGEDLIAESAVDGSRRGVVVDGGGFVDYGADRGVFVEEDAGDEVLVGEVLGAEV
jgi:hypothetical protein